MKLHAFLFLSVAPWALCLTATPAAAQGEPNDTAARPTDKVAEEVFSTGVAKGRDRLDSATSTSALRGEEADKLGAHSLSEILRNIPGLRVDPTIGEVNGNYTIRGLPMASNGSKFMQLAEDGLPVLEFADIFQLSADVFLRQDFNVGQIETLRGGSASTFASNSPGGVINLISKTGDTPGGSIAVTEGLNFAQHRIDADYGASLSDTLRFHIGGFYRQGEGPRRVGFDAQRGGQVKFNITKQFSNGYLRLYLKLLDDRTPFYSAGPIAVSGTDANPVYASLPGFDIRRDTILSRNIPNALALDRNNRVTSIDVRDGQHAVEKAVGLEGQFDVAGWTVTDKFRFSVKSGDIVLNQALSVAPAALLAESIVGPGGQYIYATGPNTGQVIVDPAALNGNGLAQITAIPTIKIRNLDTVTNDLRASKVWNVNGGALTMTLGYYKSRQNINKDWLLETVINDVAGGGNTALLNLTTGTGLQVTQNGVLAYGIILPNGVYHRSFDVRYNVDAPYGSLNYHIGKVAIGGSLRYDFGRARGTLFGADLGGGRIGAGTVDINGDGVISVPETNVSLLPLGSPGLVNYNYRYLSYSTGINYRVAESLAVFARYSKGGRAGADRILFSGFLDNAGRLIDPANAYNTVRQTEIGMKFRTANATLNITAFSAKAGDLNAQVNTGADGRARLETIVRTYMAKGVEVEGSVRKGSFSLAAAATYTDAEIADDLFGPALIGNVPRGQPKFIFALTPQYNSEILTIGANFVGTTWSYAQDTNQLRMPGYTTVNTFLQIRPAKRLQLALKVNNVFNKLAIVAVTQPALPPTGVVSASTLIGRTVSTTASLSF